MWGLVMTEKMKNRLLVSLNYACTYEKEVVLNNNIIDIIEEFEMQDKRVILYGFKDTYSINYTNIKCEVCGARIKFIFVDTTQYILLI